MKRAWVALCLVVACAAGSRQPGGPEPGWDATAPRSANTDAATASAGRDSVGDGGDESARDAAIGTADAGGARPLVWFLQDAGRTFYLVAELDGVRQCVEMQVHLPGHEPHVEIPATLPDAASGHSASLWAHALANDARGTLGYLIVDDRTVVLQGASRGPRRDPAHRGVYLPRVGFLCSSESTLEGDADSPVWDGTPVYFDREICNREAATAPVIPQRPPHPKRPFVRVGEWCWSVLLGDLRQP